MLAEQVVTASGFHQSHLLAPASISVVSPQDIASRPVRDLAEALANVPGVSIDASVSKTGGYGISIRGMPSSYTLVLIDGKRVNADSSLFPNGFGDSTTSFMPPLSMIEKIEVVRGLLPRFMAAMRSAVWSISSPSRDMINGELALAMTILSKRINPLAIRKGLISTPQVP